MLLTKVGKGERPSQDLWWCRQPPTAIFQFKMITFEADDSSSEKLNFEDHPRKPFR